MTFRGSSLRKLAKHLSSSLAGDVFFDERTRYRYSIGACMYRIVPLGVVLPYDGDDVQKIVTLAREFDVPVIARGAGAGLTGGALGRGLIVDFSKYMNRILSVDVDNRRVWVEPGVVQNDLDKALERYNLFFPPDPSSRNYCTLGGMVANNGAGPHSLKYGVTRDHVYRISMVMSDGLEATFHRSMSSVNEKSESLRELLRKVASLIQKNQNILNKHAPQTSKNASGYLLNDVLRKDGSLNMTGLLTASEGTLGLFTELELGVHEKPSSTGLILLFFDSLESAGEAVLSISEYQPSMIELMEDTFIDLVRKSSFEIKIPLPRDLKALLLVEFDGDCEDEVKEKLEACQRRVVGPGRAAVSAYSGMNLQEKDMLLRIRNAASPILNRMPYPYYPARFVEDGTVPVKHLPRYIVGLRKIFQKYEVEGVIFGHAGDGNIHVNPFIDLSRKDFRKVIEGIAYDVMCLLKELHGTLTGEHGDGLVRTPYIPGMAGTAYSVFEALKRLFDPENRFNPGKIIYDGRKKITDDLQIIERVLKRPSGTRLDDPEIFNELEKCSGCGACRGYCPVFSATYDERCAPRSKVDLLKTLLIYRIHKSGGFPGEEDKILLDLCYSCGTCLTECPSGVNVPDLIQAGKAAVFDANGIPFSQRIIAATGLIARLGTATRNLSNRMLGNTCIRKGMEKYLHVDRRRGLVPFRKLEPDVINEKICGPEMDQVIYFPGCFAWYNDPENEAKLTLAVLHHLKIKTSIPEADCCAIAQITSGQLDVASRHADRNVSLFYELLHHASWAVTGSPSCALAFRREYPALLKTKESKFVSAHFLDLMEYLERLFTLGKLDLSFQPVPLKVVVHQPCHARAMGVGEAALKLLGLIPELQVTCLTPRCCGMAGTFGFKKEHFDLSMKIGKPLFLEIKRENPDYIVTTCGTCRMQFEQALDIPTLHPITLLAMSYGLVSCPDTIRLVYGTAAYYSDQM